MKKPTAMLLSAILLTLFTINIAAAQPHGHKFYYYPKSNVYYDEGPGMYYYNHGSSWSGVKVLPSAISISIGTPRVAVYHNGPEVWRDNPRHMVIYRAYRGIVVKNEKHKRTGLYHHR